MVMNKGNLMFQIKAFPDQWIITYCGDFVRIKDKYKSVDAKLEAIQQKLKLSGRFLARTSEQVSKERYDKVLEEVDFDYEKLHEWIYDNENQEKIELISLDGQDLLEATQAIFNYVKSSKQKWRVRSPKNSTKKDVLQNEETGQVIYSNFFTRDKIMDLYWDSLIKDSVAISFPEQKSKYWEKGKWIYDSVVIFLHGTYGAIGQFPSVEEKFPHTKFVYLNSPILQYDMWHGLQPAPGGQCKGWINITGDAWELMDNDVAYPMANKTLEAASKIIHLDYPQLKRATHYIKETIEREIAKGISPEKIVIGGFSQGGLLTLAVSLTSPYKLGGFFSLCGLLPCHEKLLNETKDNNKNTPCLIINNTKDSLIPFWSGKKTYDILKERDYNVEFKTYPGLGHSWKNEDIECFLQKTLSKKSAESKTNDYKSNKPSYHIPFLLMAIATFFCFLYMLWKKYLNDFQKLKLS